MRTASPPKPSLAAWRRLMRVHCLVVRCAEKELKTSALTLPQFDVIAALACSDGGCTQEELCDRLLVTKGNVSGLISRMAQEGLVSRQEDPSDRRCNRIALTAKGRRLLESAAPGHEACMEGLFSALNEREQEQLSALLAKLLHDVRVRAGCSCGG